MLDQFKRVEYGDLALIAAATSIILLLAVFITVSIRSFLMPKAALDALAALPLDDSPPAGSSAPSTHPSPTQP